MFSGIVKGKFPLVAREDLEGLTRLTIDLGELSDGLGQGASVSVSGVCLTATTIDGARVSFDLMAETLNKTSLGGLSVGDHVNIERSFHVGDEIGGHILSGHVTGTAEIIKRETPPQNCIVTLKVDPTWMEMLLPKGFVALDGCSLTIVNVGLDWFTVHLIPETLRLTTFGEKTVGAKINLEIDPQTQAIVETVKRYLHSVVLNEVIRSEGTSFCDRSDGLREDPSFRMTPFRKTDV